jgi:hypothetical protein
VATDGTTVVFTAQDFASGNAFVAFFALDGTPGFSAVIGQIPDFSPSRAGTVWTTDGRVAMSGLNGGGSCQAVRVDPAGVVRSGPVIVGAGPGGCGAVALESGVGVSTGEQWVRLDGDLQVRQTLPLGYPPSARTANARTSNGVVVVGSRNNTVNEAWIACP